MARFSDNPQKNPLSGTELMAATDAASGNDIAITPLVLTQFVTENMGLANGSSQGAVSGPNGDKLNALYSKAQIDNLLAQLGQVPFPIFIGTPVDGTIEIFRNVTGNAMVFDFMWFALASGSTNLTVLIDGTPVTGWTGINITSASNGAVATAAKTLLSGSILALQFSASSTPKNLRLSLLSNLALLPP